LIGLVANGVLFCSRIKTRTLNGRQLKRTPVSASTFCSRDTVR
jgi:hypothetical protein